MAILSLSLASLTLRYFMKRFRHDGTSLIYKCDSFVDEKKKFLYIWRITRIHATLENLVQIEEHESIFTLISSLSVIKVSC